MSVLICYIIIHNNEKTVTVDIAALLPTDRGTTTYGPVENNAAYVKDPAVSEEGKLTYVTLYGLEGARKRADALAAEAKPAEVMLRKECLHRFSKG